MSAADDRVPGAVLADRVLAPTAQGSSLTIVSGEPGYSYPLLVTDMSPDDELGVQIGEGPNGEGGASVAMTVDAARVLRDYLTGWIVSKETKR